MITIRRYKEMIKAENLSMPPRDTVYDSPLHRAAFGGDHTTLQRLLSNPDNLSQIALRNHLGCTPLRLAATAGNDQCLLLLISHGAQVNVVDIKGQTPLFVAVKNNHIGCVHILLDKGADPNGSKDCLCTPLYVAAMQGHAECIQLLVDAGVDVNRSHTQGAAGLNGTALYISFTYRHLECFLILLKAGADPDLGCKSGQIRAEYSLLNAAVKWGDINFVKPLVDFGARVSLNNEVKTKVSSPTEQERTLRASLDLVDYIQYIQSVPMSLQSQCRIAIRECLGMTRLKNINSLPVPKYLGAYLAHEI
ncbi:ankyrin repeat and SOCS box protein 1-like [Amphiura filiformis]|uniref:ankyrin repeat and SOCS box protein 1-like n=1 Tax=Amphiura filiformis TaxID=82378 RepID=UPI003B2180B3